MPNYKVQSCDGGYEVGAIDEGSRGLHAASLKRCCRQLGSRTSALRRLLVLVALITLTALVLAAAPAGSGTAGRLVQASGELAADEICTIASIERQATVEVQVEHAADFCELLSQALAISVFRMRLLVTPGVLWHYAGSDPTCQLRFGRTHNRMLVRNSVRTCRWFARHATGWRAEVGEAPGSPAASSTPEWTATRLGQ